MTDVNSWQFWALLSAVFAALTAVLAKAGVDNISADVATFYRTAVVIVAMGVLLAVTGQFEVPRNVSSRQIVFLTLSGLATGASWLCYFKALKIGNVSQVAPIDKLSVVLAAIFGVVFLGEKLNGAGWTGVVLMGLGALFIAFKS